MYDTYFSRDSFINICYKHCHCIVQHISGTEQIFKYLFVVLYLHCNGQFERIFSELSELFSFDVKLKVPFVNSVYLTMQQVSQQP